MKNKKTYVLGMAKSSLQLEKGSYGGVADKMNPGTLRNLELDFLRLAYATKELQTRGHEVYAYLMVSTDIVAQKVQIWAEKYEAGENLINIVSAALTEDEIKYLIEEKENNRTANTPHSINKETNAKADYGKSLIESKLKAHIEEKHGEIEAPMEVKSMPFMIKWDYFREIS